MKRMESKTKHRVGALLLAALFAVLGSSTIAAANLQELVRETQRGSDAGGQMTMVWWMPHQFWDEGLKANPGMTPEVRTQVLSGLADYTVIAMLRAKTGAGGLTEVQPKAELLKNVRVEMNGKQIEPLPPEQVSPVAQLLLAQLKPAMAAMAGQIGAAMEFVVYPAKTADGTMLADALQSGVLRIKLYENTFNWRLPLGSLLPARTDKKTGEDFPGNFEFNPFTGDKLSIR
ncbi:MAG: hypothetical protein ABIQ86_16000 [Steroidobacteraceae bacterium]